MAQLVEQRIRNAWVPGSSPGIGSKAIHQTYLLYKRNQHIGSARASQAWEAGSIPVFRSLLCEIPTIFVLTDMDYLAMYFVHNTPTKCRLNPFEPL